MAYDIRMVKIVTGEIVIGKFEEDKQALIDVAIVQSVPTQQGMQLMMLPYGYPFDQECCGKIDAKNFLYDFSRIPEDMKTKYLEVCSNLSLSSGGLNPNPTEGSSGLIL